MFVNLQKKFTSEKNKNILNLMVKFSDDEFKRLLVNIYKNGTEQEAVEYIEQLSASLRVEISEIKNFIELIVDIIREITEHSPDPTHLQSGLLSLGIFSTEKAAIFTNIHETQSLEFLQRLNSKLCSPFDLISVKGNLGLNCCSSDCDLIRTTSAFFDFQLRDDEKQNSFIAEFQHNDLNNFYRDVEILQRSIDEFSNR